jgi:hypothetical protein
MPMQVKSTVKRYRQVVLDGATNLSALVLAPLFARVARTGVGSEHCLQHKYLPLPVHYYSPVPDVQDLERRNVWNHRSALAGIDFQAAAQEALLLKLGDEFGQECQWPATPTEDPYQFYTQVVNFSYGCAAVTHCMVRHFQPRHVIEVGSGNSSLVLAAALRANGAEGQNTEQEYVVVDPYPRRNIEKGLPGLTGLNQQPVETLSPEFFDRLGANDILFIDSSHTVRIAGDVNFLILEVLPRLAPGVLVHFHDIDLPREYPKTYITNPRFRVLWTETYLLQAFLSCNSQFELLLAMSYLMHDRPTVFQRAFPHYDPVQHRLYSSSFWIRRRA